MLFISNKWILHLSVATLIPSLQNWHSWTNRSKPINAPEYNSNINGQTGTLPDIQPQVQSHAKNTEEDLALITTNSEE